MCANKARSSVNLFFESHRTYGWTDRWPKRQTNSYEEKLMYNISDDSNTFSHKWWKYKQDVQINVGFQICLVSIKLEVENHSQFAELSWTSLSRFQFCSCRLTARWSGGAGSISRPWENLRREEPKAEEFAEWQICGPATPLRCNAQLRRRLFFQDCTLCSHVLS